VHSLEEIICIPGHILYMSASLKVLEIYILIIFVLGCSYSILLSLILLSVFNSSHKISFATVLVGARGGAVGWGTAL
jgi:hypothetical protein